MVSTAFLAVPPKTYGGTELVVYELVEGLAAKGHDVTLFATGDSTANAKLRYLYPESQWPPHSLTDVNHVSWAMAEIIADESFDVVHVHSAAALSYLRFAPDLPLVYTLHHAPDKTVSDYYRRFQSAWFIAISERQRQLESPLQNCHVIHHGIDERRYEWVEEAEDYVCFIARFAKVKGPHTAIDVAAKAGRRIRVAGEMDANEHAFGQKEVMPRLKAPHVEYLGCLGNEGKIPLLRDARALLAPIEWEEPFGLFLIEAMLSGCPVVAFPRGSVTEIVEPGVTGFIVESADEMAALIRPGGAIDFFDRRRCRERAVQRFGRSRFVTDHEKLYMQMSTRTVRAGWETPVLQSI